MANKLGGNGGGAGFRPHELLGQKSDARTGDDGDAKTVPPLPASLVEAAEKAIDAIAPKGKKEISKQAETVASDVLQLTHRQAKEAQSIRYKKADARAALAQGEAITKAEGKLHIAGEVFKLTAKQDAAMTLLEPNEKTITHLAAGIASGRATLISAATGSGAAHTARWFCDATHQRWEHAKITRTTALDALVGGMRPDENRKLRVLDGPLARCIRNGGVFILDGLENADPQIIAALRALAKGAKFYHHPVSGQVIEVHKDFRLVMIGDRAKRFDRDLVDASNHREIRAYDREEHARLLVDQLGLSQKLASLLATFHDGLQTADKKGEIAFGRGFPLAWPLLSTAGARLAKKRDPQPKDILDALYGVYGARLGNPDNIAAFDAEVKKLELGDPVEAKVKRSQDPSFVHTPAIDRALSFAESALDAGESVLLTAAGQSGATRLVAELANRRGQELVTVVGHAGTDPQTLMETPVFTEKGELYFRPGRVATALLEGKMLYIDHVDHLSRDRQNAFFQLQHLKTIKVVVDGKVVEKPVHKNARIILSATEGQQRGRYKPDPADRASVTEVRLKSPAIEELKHYVPAEIQKDAKIMDRVETIIRGLHEENPDSGVTKLQRFIDFARTTHLLSEHMSVEEAALKATQLLFNVDPKKSPTMQRLEADAAAAPPAEKKDRPLYQRLFEMTQKEEDKRLAKVGYLITESMIPQLDALAIAYRLGRPVLAVGPASSGKTVLGQIFAALVEKKNIRVNFSASTESRDLLGGLGPVNEQGKTVFRHVEGPQMRAADVEAVLNADEWNLSREGQMAFKAWVDHRRMSIDPEADIDRAIKSAFLFATQNPNDPKTGRTAPPPTITDCMFHIFVDEKPIDEKVEIVKSQCKLSEPLVRCVASFFVDLARAVEAKALTSAVGPITCTERDMLKAARTAQYIFERDKIKDPAEQRRVLGREVYRLVRDMLLDSDERQKVLDLIRMDKHFGKDVEPPARAAGVKKIDVVQDGKKVTMLQIGDARFPIRPLGKDKELDALVPDLDGVFEPVGEQLEFLESVLLSLELNQPLAVVGPTGTGKTMLMKFLAHHLGMPWRELPFHADMTEDHIFGTTVITKDGKVEFQYSPLSNAIKKGGLFIGDEFLTLPNSTREKLNPVTEGSEIQISQKRPPETIGRKDWDESFRFVVTTNGSDIRDDGFSDAEASRMRIIGLRELSTQADLETIALRDYVKAAPAEPYAAPARTDATRREAAAALEKLIDKRTAPGKQLMAAIAASLDGEAAPEIDAAQIAAVKLDAAKVKTFADALNVFTYDKKDAPLRQVLNLMLARAEGEEHVARVAELAPPESLDAEIKARADRVATVEIEIPPRAGAPKDAKPTKAIRLTRASEAEKAADFFFRLRELQKDSGDEGLSPLTPRLFTSFMDLFTQLRGRTSLAAAATRAAELSLWAKLGRKLEKKAINTLVEVFGQNDRAIEKYSAPEQTEKGVRFGDTFVPYGSERPWKGDNSRFPFTPARCKNLTLLADAVEMGRGRPISCTDDENGETVETLREFGHLTGRQVTVVSLPPNVDIESLIERLAVSDDPNAKGGFEPELQQIAQAVKEGHVLVLRGCGNIPTAKLERLNSLGDGRQGIRLPRSGEWLEAAPGFRMVMMRSPGSVHEYSPALQNRLIEPLLTTRSATEAPDVRAAELALAIQERTKISETAALRLGAFHMYLNQLIRDGKFASGSAVGSLLNRDAEAIGHRLRWLQDRHVVEDELEMLHYLAMEVYGERFLPERDKEFLREKADSWFGADGRKINLSSDINPSPHLMRVGEWVVPRDPGGVREGVPGPEAMLPATKSLDRVFQKVVSAAQWNEAIHLHGDDFVADACVKTLARITTSPLVTVEGNEELQEAYLFGGLIQDQKTGEFKEHEGLLWKAQREGGTLLVKNASKIPAEVLTHLAEIAATGHVSRIHEGKLEVKKAAFRLILHTSQGDQPLLREMASLCTRVGCPQVSEDGDLRTLISHIMQKVPGGPEIAAALVKFGNGAAKLLAQRAQVGRQPIRFDSKRLLEAAQQIAAEHEGKQKPLETAISEVIARAYLRPAEGLDMGEKLEELLETVNDELSGVLALQDVAPIDIVDKPEVGALRQDYEQVAPVMSGELLRATAAAIDAAMEKNANQKLRAALQGMIGTRLFPQAIVKRLEKAIDTLGAKLTDEARAELNTLARHLEKQAAAGEVKFEDTALDFLRGARMWDLEYRLAILSRYDGAFAELAGAGAASAKDKRKQIERVLERFDAAGATDKLELAREAVQKAIHKYKNRKGEADEQLQGLLRDLLNKWDLVATSPIFKNHHLLRNELQSLDKLLAQLEDAHKARGAPAIEVGNLVGALRDAGEVLEGIRLAEQSAELRRGLERAQKDTQSIVDDLRGELVEIRRLEEAGRRHDSLAAGINLLREIEQGDLFMHLRLDDERVDRPVQRSDAELQQEARDRAKVELAFPFETRRIQALQRVQAQGAAVAPLDPTQFFQGFNVEQADVGLTVDFEAVGAQAGDRAYAAEMQAFEEQCERDLNQKSGQYFRELKDREEQRATTAYKERVSARANQIAARVHKSAQELDDDLWRLSNTVDLFRLSPELHAELAEVRKDLDRASKEARSWAGEIIDFMAEVGRGMLRFFTFNLLGKKEVRGAPNDISLDEVKARVGGLLKKIGAAIQKEDGALPDFRKIGAHQQLSEQLTTQLMAADTMGDLAAKYAKLVHIQDAENYGDLKRWLGVVLGRMANDRELKEVLLRVDAFCVSAKKLTAELPQDGGVAVELAPVLEGVMRAAEAIRSQPLAQGSYQSSIKALKVAEQRIEDFAEENGGALHPLIVAVREEMSTLLADFRRLGGDNDQALDLQTAAMAELFRAHTKDDEDLSAELKNAFGELAESAAVDEAIAASPTDAAFERVLERSNAPTQAERELSEVIRETRLNLIDIDLDRVRELRAERAGEVMRKKGKGDEEVPAEVIARREEVIAAARGLEAKAVDAIGKLDREKESLTKRLGELDDATSLGAITHWKSQLEGAAELLQSAIDAGGGRGFNPRKPLDLLRKAAKALRATEKVPVEIAAKLDAAIEGARPLEAAFASDRFVQLALGWCADALLIVREAENALGEKIAELGRGEDHPEKTGRILDELLPIVERVGGAKERLGAWSRFSLLSHVHQRVSALETTFPEDAKEKAANLVARARAGAENLHRLSGGKEAETCAADAYEAYIELADKMSKLQKLDDGRTSAYRELGGHLWTLIGPQEDPNPASFDFDACSEAIELAEKLTKGGTPSSQETARELSLSLGGLRSAALVRALDDVESSFKVQASEYLGGVKESRLRLGDATRRFLEYDPLKEQATIPELARELKAAVVQASERQEGPAAVLLAQELIRLRDGLAAIAEGGGPMAADARAIDRELEPMIKGATLLAQHPDAPERFTTMMELYGARLKKARDGGLKRENLQWATKAQAALLEVMKAGRDEMAAVLDRVENELFPEEAEKRRQRLAPPVVVAQDEPKIESKVASLLAAGGGGGGGRARGGDDVAYGSAGARALNLEGVRALGRAGLGLSDSTPPEIEGPWGPGEREGTGKVRKGPDIDRDGQVRKLDREALPDGKITERSDKLRAVELSDEGLREMRKRMNDELNKVRKAAEAALQEAAKEEILTEFEAFIEEHSDLVDKLADTLRQHPGLETVVVLDQSGSTWIERRPLAHGETQILDQERATLAIVLAAHMRAERNCAVVGFGGNNVGEGKPVSTAYDRDHNNREVSVFVHKPMAERLDNAWANKAYGLAGNWGGYTDLIEPMNVAAGQFTDKANNKLILVLTDAQIGNPVDVHRYIENRRAEGIGVAVMGFGEATHIEEVAGNVDDPRNPGFGMHVKNFANAIQGGARLFAKTVVQNAGFRGNVKGAAQGIGIAHGQAALSAGVSRGPMDSSMQISEPPVLGPDPGEVYGSKGPRREMKNLVDRPKYERALRELEQWQNDVATSAKYRACLQEIYELRSRHERDGIIESLREAVLMSLPKTRGQEWERKQLSGSLFDEEQLPMYVVGLAQGVPVMRIFKRKRPTEDTKATVVLAIDESSSMGDSDKMKANLEALIAYGDALKAADPDVKIAVVGFSDKVRLHAGFEQEWDDALKAHLLYQVQGTYDATDDERMGRESIGLLDMVDADVGQVISFSDGQGMPGMHSVMEMAAESGYAFLTIGVGPECKAVGRFDRHGLYVRNLSLLSQKLPAAQIGAWEAAGRIIQ